MATVCVWTGVGHRKQKGLAVSNEALIKLVVELFTVDRFSACAVAARKVASCSLVATEAWV